MYPQHMFWLKNKKTIFLLRTLLYVNLPTVISSGELKKDGHTVSCIWHYHADNSHDCYPQKTALQTQLLLISDHLDLRYQLGTSLEPS